MSALVYFISHKYCVDIDQKLDCFIKKIVNIYYIGIGLGF